MTSLVHRSAGLVLSATLGCASAPALPTTQLTDTHVALTRDVRALAAPLVERGWAPGVALALVHGDAATFISLGATERGGVPVTEDTVFDIGSLTKVFTAILLADAVERGTATLDARLVDVLPGTPPGDARTPWPGTAITLEHLATHRAGLPEWPRGFDFAHQDDPFVGYDASRVLEELAQTPLDRPPGEGDPSYSSLGMGLLGLALERRAGKDYEALVRDQIAGPLGLTHTAIGASPSEGAASARGHDDAGQPIAPWVWRDRALAGAGALRSTARDLSRFIRAQLGAAGGAAEPPAAALRLAARPRAPLPGGGHVGLGWGLDEDGTLSHEGQTSGFHAWLGVDPRTQTGVAVLTNAMGGPVAELGQRILDRLRGAPPRALTLPESIEVERARAERHVGHYASPEGLAFDVIADPGGLRLSIDGGRAYRLYAASPSRWFLRVGGVAVRFEDDGAVLEVGRQQLRGARSPPRTQP